MNDIWEQVSNGIFTGLVLSACLLALSVPVALIAGL